MKIIFKINYETNFGQHIMIKGSHPKLGNNNDEEAVKMFPKGNGDWDHVMELDESENTNFEYKYFLFDEYSGVKLFEWGDHRNYKPLQTNVNKIIIQDYWRSAKRTENVLFTSAFLNSIFKRENIGKQEISELKITTRKRLLRLSINAPRVEPNHYLAVIGSTKELGNWNLEKAIPMYDHDFPNWKADVLISNTETVIEYKYCIIDKITGKVVLDEYKKRELYINKEDKADAYCISDEDFKYPRYDWKGTGVAIPVFSLRSNQGMGIGEFSDLKLLVDWARKTGIKMIQILPINDTVATHTWTDSYPYAAISVFALHPIYLRLQDIGNLSSKITQEIVNERRKLLNQLDKIDYEAVMKVKARFIKHIYDEQKNDFRKDKEFKSFLKKNEQWLKPYSVFSYLRDLFGTPDFTKWGRFSSFSKKIIKELTDVNASHYDDIEVHYFQQYHLHKQLIDASEYARENGIVLKGDIPIGIYRNSVDAWVKPELYNMDGQAGAPPDDFSDEGQNWKFPTYNWNEMAKDGFSWWRRRLQKLSEYFDAFRIDHILGFFRIWEIPASERQGIMGRFNPAWALHIDEIKSKGIHFDYLRYCRPYIREHMLYPLFGELTDYIKQNCLVESAWQTYYIKDEYNTQKKVEQAFKIYPDTSNNEKNRLQKIQTGLFYLLSEVLFFELKGSNGTQFHPRHSFFKTYSYQELDMHTQRKLMELYNDYFYRRNEDFWREQAMIKLPAIKEATNMLICGEDLGMVPECVPDVINDLGILSLEVQRMPKDPKIKFAHPANYPYLSVATPSSHDTSTIRGWWEEDTSRSQEFFTQILGRYGGSPFFCETWIVKDIINQHLYSPSMWTVFPIQDLLGMDDKLRLTDAKAERINQPANPNHYWRYRMHINLEQLINENDFNTMLLKMIEETGRNQAY